MTYTVKESDFGAMMQYLGLKVKDVTIIKDGEWMMVKKLGGRHDVDAKDSK